MLQAMRMLCWKPCIENTSLFELKSYIVGKLFHDICHRYDLLLSRPTKVQHIYIYIYINNFVFLDRAFSIMTKINQQNAKINSGLIYY